VKKLRIGSRGSKLALWQAQYIQQKLGERAGRNGIGSVESEIVIVRTSGDAMPDAPIASVGTKGVFIKELEDELLSGRIDLAVHSMKDVPTELPAGLVIAAVAKRADSRDCLLSRSRLGLAALPAGAKIGTSSLRRQCQLKRYRGDLEIRDVRGNVDTRIRKMETGEFDAIVLAKAGVDRLGLSARIAEILEPEVMLSAVGQGAMGVEIRADDAEGASFVRTLDDPDTHRAVDAERALLKRLEGGCQVPLGALAQIESGRLKLEAAVFSANGSDAVRREISGSPDEAESLGKRLAEELLETGAEAILTSLTRGYSV
jgi:hydroxymethylbilane synthase